MSLGANIKKYRKAKHMTQAELGKPLSVSHATVGRYESDDITPPLDKLVLLSDILEHDFVSDYLDTINDSIGNQARESVEALQSAKENYKRANELLDKVEELQDLSKLIIPSCIEGMGYSWDFDFDSLIWSIYTDDGITKYISNDKLVELFDYYLKHLKMDFDELLSDTEEGYSNVREAEEEKK